jgi:hypothetical protein
MTTTTRFALTLLVLAALTAVGVLLAPEIAVATTRILRWFAYVWGVIIP